MAKIIDSRAGVDQTVRIFDQFYNFDLVINGTEYDAVHAYFMSVCDTAQIAGNFTVYLFRIAQETKVPVMDLLGYIQGLNGLEMNSTIIYYLNSFKSKTALYGIGTVPQTNQLVARNIVQ